MGIALVGTFPESGGNLGPMDLGLRFLPPKGMGLSIDAGPVSGGGYILADYDRGEYAGILHLEISGTISITAIALLQTRMPDGSQGFSLVVLISAEFPGIQLGYGFTLNGLGGIAGINRSLNVPALQDGLRRGAIGSLLFPVDPVPRARQIIADVGAIFPPTQGQFVIGPMVKLGWGAGMVSATLAIVIQVPALKIALLGRIQLLLPPIEEEAIVVLRLDFAGIFDLPAKTISFDGSLDGSRVAVFAITGDIAMRASFGDRPDFAMSVGGLHPAYRPPAGFPSLRRLSIALADSDNPRVRMEAYFAVTPATLQFGARAEVYYGIDIPLIGMIDLDAGTSFDALITFPATFVVGLDVHVLLRRNGQPFIGVELDITLTGAQPMDIDGRATLHFLGDHSIPFHATIGGEPQAPALAPVDLEGGVRVALGEARNWSAAPPTAAGGVRMRDLQDDAGPQRVHPLGTLAVHQTVAPLGVTLEKAGEAEIAGARLMALDGITVAGGFAPAPRSPDRDRAVRGRPVLPHVRPPAARAARVRADGGRGARDGERPAAGAGTRTLELGFEETEIPPEEDAPAILYGVRLVDAPLVAWMVRGGVAAAGPAAAARRFDGETIGIVVDDPKGWAVAPTAAPTAGGRLAGAEAYGTAAEAFAAAKGRDVVVARVDEVLA